MIEFEFVFKDLAYSDKLKFQREVIKPHVMGRDKFLPSPRSRNQPLITIPRSQPDPKNERMSYYERYWCQ